MIEKLKIPAAFALIKKGNVSLLIRDSYKDLLTRMGIEETDDFLQRHRDPSRTFEGRSQHYSIALGDGVNLFVRRYSHGGLFRFFTRDLFLLGARAFEELIFTEQVRSSGIATLEPVAAIHRRVFPLFYRAYLLSRELPRAINMVEYLRRIGAFPARELLCDKRETIRRVACVVRQFHDLGYYHRDLQLKNILLSDHDILLIDFDRCCRIGRISTWQRVKNLLRLYRSAEKWRSRGIPITRTDCWRFFLNYSGDDEAVRQVMRRALRTFSFYMILHRIFWILEMTLSRKQKPAPEEVR